MENAAVNQEYLFKSAHSALTFAYNFSSQQGATPSLMSMMLRGPSPKGKGLSGIDGAAQAGLIKASVARLDPYERHMIEARFEMVEKNRLAAMMFFIPVIVSNLPTGVHSRRAADVLVQKWFGKRLRLQAAAQEIGAHRNTVGPMWATTKHVLQSIWERAEDAADRELQKAGIIP